MHTRNMTAADLPRVFALWRECEGVGLSEGDTIEGITAFLTRNPGTSWVAFAEDRLIGAVLAGHDGRRGFLYHLAVSAESRGQGAGSALVRHALEGLGAVGIRKCHVMVYRDNAEGQRFWERLGWAQRGDINVRTIVF